MQEGGGESPTGQIVCVYRVVQMLNSNAVSNKTKFYNLYKICTTEKYTYTLCKILRAYLAQTDPISAHHKKEIMQAINALAPDHCKSSQTIFSPKPSSCNI